MLKKQTAELRPSKRKKQSKLAILKFGFLVVRLLTNLFKATDVLWEALKSLLNS